MPVDTSLHTEESVTHLLTGIVADAQDLAVKHLELFRSEMLQEIHKTTEALVSLAVGCALLQIGGLLFGQMFAYMIVQLAPSISLWQAYAIVAVVTAGCGAIPLLIGISRLRELQAFSRGATRVSS
jgi:hypothetical protein